MAENISKMELTDEKGNVVMTFDGETGNLISGGHGHDGDVVLKDSKGDITIHLNAFDGAIHLGGPDQDGDIKLKNKNNENTIHLNGRSAAVHLGGGGEDGEVFIKNSEGSEVIILDGNKGDITVNGASVATADYVFQKDYQLTSLENVKKHIEEFQHLPGVPSSADMKKEGLSLNNFSMKLLEKVEELTLYIIDQQEVIKAQEARISALENK